MSSIGDLFGTIGIGGSGGGSFLSTALTIFFGSAILIVCGIVVCGL